MRRLNYDGPMSPKRLSLNLQAKHDPLRDPLRGTMLEDWVMPIHAVERIAKIYFIENKTCIGSAKLAKLATAHAQTDPNAQKEAKRLNLATPQKSRTADSRKTMPRTNASDINKRNAAGKQSSADLHNGKLLQLNSSEAKMLIAKFRKAIASIPININGGIEIDIFPIALRSANGANSARANVVVVEEHRANGKTAANFALKAVSSAEDACQFAHGFAACR